MTGLLELIQGLAMIGIVTAVVVGMAVRLARKEEQEATSSLADDLVRETMRRAS